MLMAAGSWRQSDITPTSAVEVAVSDETVEVLVIGAGQAGIAMSEHLGKQGIDAGGNPMKLIQVGVRVSPAPLNACIITMPIP